MNWSEWCPVHRQQPGHLMEVRRGQLVRRLGCKTEWHYSEVGEGRGEMQGGKEKGEQICCSAMLWPSADLRQTIITWLPRLPLLLQHKHLSFSITVVTMWERTTAQLKPPFRGLVWQHCFLEIVLIYCNIYSKYTCRTMLCHLDYVFFIFLVPPLSSGWFISTTTGCRHSSLPENQG